MTEEETRLTVIRLLKNIAPDSDPEQLQPEENIRQTLGIDSFDYLQFIIALDEHFGIQTPEEDYGKLEKLPDVIGYLMQKKEVSKGKV